MRSIIGRKSELVTIVPHSHIANCNGVSLGLDFRRCVWVCPNLTRHPPSREGRARRVLVAPARFAFMRAAALRQRDSEGADSNPRPMCKVASHATDNLSRAGLVPQVCFTRFT